MPLGRDRRQRRRRVAAAGAAGAYAVHKHNENKREGEEQEQQDEVSETALASQAQDAPMKHAGSPDDSVAELTQLKSLLDSGALTQGEFDAEKQKIIGA
jgi:Short C-terminal domain